MRPLLHVQPTALIVRAYRTKPLTVAWRSSLLPAKCFTSTTSFGWHQPYLNAAHDVVFQSGTRRNT
jgi:hypothetical protein